MQHVKVNMHHIIEKVLSSLNMQLERKKVKVSKALHATLSEIEGDPVHLTNVVINLIDNAIKYSPEAPEIRIETKEANGQFLLSISDNGIGISRDQQKRVFEKLYRVPTGNIHNVKGFGLGLSYVKAIVEKHKGMIRLESEPEVGSTFNIYLPYNQNTA
jgi:two-component system phosphate regulon sensor histidine kinase PhoR